MTLSAKIGRSLEQRGLAEVAIVHTVFMVGSGFGLLLLLAFLVSNGWWDPVLWFPILSSLWLTGIGWLTWIIVREGRAKSVSVSLVPIQLFQSLLIVMTIVSFVVHRDSDWELLNGLILVWEVWCALFTFLFLLLVLLMGKRLSLSTWASSILLTAWIAHSLWKRM